MTPWWGRFIVALRLLGVPGHPPSEITGPTSEGIEEQACQRTFAMSGEELRGRTRARSRPAAPKAATGDSRCGGPGAPEVVESPVLCVNFQNRRGAGRRLRQAFWRLEDAAVGAVASLRELWPGNTELHIHKAFGRRAGHDSAIGVLACYITQIT